MTTFYLSSGNLREIACFRLHEVLCPAGFGGPQHVLLYVPLDSAGFDVLLHAMTEHTAGFVVLSLSFTFCWEIFKAPQVFLIAKLFRFPILKIWESLFLPSVG
jgi:hypothetical protein